MCVIDDFTDVIGTDVGPLPDQQQDQLSVSLQNLLKMMEPEEVISRLYSEKCINQLQCEHLTTMSIRASKIRELVDILKKRSYADFKKFLDILKKDNQGHVAKIIEEGGEFTWTTFPVIGGHFYDKKRSLHQRNSYNK